MDKRPYPGFIKAYGHNGYFKSLEEIVHFYNTRDVSGAGWPLPEVADNINTAEMGNLGVNVSGVLTGERPARFIMTDEKHL